MSHTLKPCQTTQVPLMSQTGTIDLKSSPTTQGRYKRHLWECWVAGNSHKFFRSTLFIGSSLFTGDILTGRKVAVLSRVMPFGLHINWPFDQCLAMCDVFEWRVSAFRMAALKPELGLFWPLYPWEASDAHPTGKSWLPVLQQKRPDTAPSTLETFLLEVSLSWMSRSLGRVSYKYSPLICNVQE